MKIKKIISLMMTTAVIASQAGILTAYAENPGGKVAVKSFVEDEATNTVFVGEDFKAKIILEDFEQLKAFQFIMMYDNTVAQLKATDGNDTTLEQNGITVNGEYTIPMSFAKREEGVWHIAAFTADAFDVEAETDAITMDFTALKEGNVNLRFADNENESEVKLFNDIAIVEFGTPIDLKDLLSVETHASNVSVEAVPKTINVEMVTVKNAPNSPVDLSWKSTGYASAWTAPEGGCRGYLVEVWKDGVKVSDDTVDAVSGQTEYEYDILDVINTEGIGTYNVKVAAKGGTNNSSFVETGDKEVTAIPLDAPTNVALDETTKKLTWDSVENAAKYSVTVKKDGETAPVFQKDDVVATEYSLTDALATVGDYTIEVIAKTGDALHGDSPAVTVTYSTGSTIKGTVLYRTDKKNRYEVNPDVKTTVKLTGDGAETYECIVDEDGTFEMSGVENGSYSVQILRKAGLTRNFVNSEGKEDKLVLDRSVEKVISASEGISMYMGDVYTSKTNMIDLFDVNALLNCWGSVTDENKECDFISGSYKGYVDMDELTVVITNFYKNANVYKGLTDYNFN